MGYWCPKCHNIFDDKFDRENKQCKQCNSFDTVCIPDDLSMTMGEFIIIAKISTDKDFCQAIVNLKEKDPIEYQLKLSQFKTQVQQQKQQQESTVPRCPTCSSTNLKKISGLSKAGSVAMWGLLSQKVKKTYHCNKCGYEW